MRRQPDKTNIYKVTPNSNLKIHLFLPEGQTKSTPVILFFHGGAFMKGHPAQFFAQCAYLSERGMVAGSVEYRLLKNGAKDIGDCLADSKSAIRWLRANHEVLNINPDQIVAGGGSAGGNLAANCAMIAGFDDPLDDLSITAVPNALVLLNPVLFPPAVAGGPDDHRFYSIDHIRKNLPPTLILHGTQDPILPFSQMLHFAQKMKQASNRCELIGFDKQGHGFFNLGRDKNRPFYESLLVTDQFLTDNGFLSGTPHLTYENVKNWSNVRR
ncbi:MAG: alpha/beta hydrolase [Chloroflexota bacterium]